MDIRLTRGRNHRIWLWTGLLFAAGLAAIVGAAVFGDPTAHPRGPGVGAAAHFGSDRAPVLPVVVEPFSEVKRLTDRELGRLVRLTGSAESGVRRNAVYVRTPEGRRILVRFEPPPPGGLGAIFNGGGVNLEGYLQKISRAEFQVWMDTLGVVIPRPAPGVKFGDLPDSNFMRIDSLFIKDFYISVRPEGIGRPGAAPPLKTAPLSAAARVTPPLRARVGAPVTTPPTPPAAPTAPPSSGDTVHP